MVVVTVQVVIVVNHLLLCTEHCSFVCFLGGLVWFFLLGWFFLLYVYTYIVLVSLGCRNKISQTGWLKQQTFILLQF